MLPPQGLGVAPPGPLEEPSIVVPRDTMLRELERGDPRVLAAVVRKFLESGGGDLATFDAWAWHVTRPDYYPRLLPIRLRDQSLWYYVWVSTEDFPSLVQERWAGHRDKRGTHSYAVRGRGRSRVYLHDEVARLMGLRKRRGWVIHHKNENRWDNRRENLELVRGDEHARAHWTRRRGQTMEPRRQDPIPDPDVR